MKKLFAFFLSILGYTCVIAQNVYPSMKVNWPSFIQQHNLVWEEMPLQWNEGAFTGNGHIGMMVYVSQLDSSIVFHVGRTDVTDHRKAPDKKTSFGVSGTSVLYDFCRLEVGAMLLKPFGKILSGTMEQDIWNAEIKGKFITTAGTIEIKAYVPYHQNVEIIEVVSTEKNGEVKADYKWRFLPGNPSSPRALVFPNNNESKSYITNPSPQLFIQDQFHIIKQPLLAGGDYATVWTELVSSKEQQSALYLSIANEVPISNKSEKVAMEAITNTQKQPIVNIKKAHQNWWHQFYQKSFLSIPDARVEAFYWIQLYKMATCSRPDGPAVDLFGPYYKTSQWPGMWWNLNIQLTYFPVYTSNHLGLGENMIKIVDENFEVLLNRFCGPKLGDLCWTMNNYWKQYAYDGNWKAIKEKWLPKAIQIYACYQKMMVNDSLGNIQLLPMESPEYRGFEKYTNSNYNLANLRWLLNTMIQSCEKSDIFKNEIKQWNQVLEKLIPYPIDKNGLMIGSHQSVDMSHRHYSHLLALYPLFQLKPDKKEDSILVDKSVDHWHKIESGKSLAGYSYTGAASLYAALGRGNDANKNLQQFLTGSTGISQFHANTFYTESDGKNPVIETPLSGAASVLEMLLQSWGGKIQVFPALPVEWKDASFSDLKAEGGFFVSASMKNKQLEWIKVKSETGEDFILKSISASQLKPIGISANNAIKYLGNGEIFVHLKKGDSILLSTGNSFKPTIEAVKHNTDLVHPFGIKKGKQLSKNQNWQVLDFIR
jgi:alpha-L-fucosidase 2